MARKKTNVKKNAFFFPFFFNRTVLFYFLQLYCPNGISPMGNSECFPQGKPAGTESRCPTYCACWVFLCFFNPSNWDMDYGIFNGHTDLMHATAQGGVRTPQESLHWKLTPGEKGMTVRHSTSCAKSYPIKHRTNFVQLAFWRNQKQTNNTAAMIMVDMKRK